MQEAERKAEASGLFVCGSTELEMGQIEDAIVKFKKAKDLDPENKQYHLSLSTNDSERVSNT